MNFISAFKNKPYFLRCIFTLLSYPLNGREGIVLWSDFRNGAFDRFTPY